MMSRGDEGLDEMEDLMGMTPTQGLDDQVEADLGLLALKLSRDPRITQQVPL